MVGGLISGKWWPAVDGEFHTGNLAFSVLEALTLIALGAVIAYQRSLLGYRDTFHRRASDRVEPIAGETQWRSNSKLLRLNHPADRKSLL